MEIVRYLLGSWKLRVFVDCFKCSEGAHIVLANHSYVENVADRLPAPESPVSTTNS